MARIIFICRKNIISYEEKTKEHRPKDNSGVNLLWFRFHNELEINSKNKTQQHPKFVP